MNAQKSHDILLKKFDKLCGNYFYQNADKIDYEQALYDVAEALEKQIPKKHFENECECIVDYEMLYTAINNKCKSKNCYCHNEYRIFLGEWISHCMYQ